MVASPGATPVARPDWFTVATLVLSLPHVPDAALVVPSDIVTVAVICSVWPTKIVERFEVTVTVETVGGGFGVTALSFLQESIKQIKAKRPQINKNLLIFPSFSL